jgi:C4-dicarboxylate transporter/malic acid transport protein
LTESKIAHLHPAWSALPLGTAGIGVISLFDPVPYLSFDELIGFGLTVIAVLLFIVIFSLNVVRIIKYPQNFREDLKHPMFGAMIGTLPASSLVLGLAIAQLAQTFFITQPLLGYIAFALAVIGVLGALLVGVLFFSSIVKNTELPAAMISGTWFIPIVVFVLVPSVMIRVSELTQVFNGGLTYLLTFAALGAGILLFIFLGAVVGWRLIATPPPPAQMAPSWIIWLAPAGAGGLGILASMRMLQVFGDQNLNLVIEIIGIFGASMFWGFGIWWLIFTIAMLLPQRNNLHFHLGSWGYTFPIAALGALTIELSRIWDTQTVVYLGIVFWIVALLLWLWLILRTAQKTLSQEIFQRA